MSINAFIIDIIVIFVDDFDKFFAKQTKTLIIIKQLKKRMFHEFHKYIETWNLKLIYIFLLHRDWNHQIDFQSKIKFFAKKVYELSKQQTQIMKKYIDDMFDKNFIKFNTFSYVVVTFKTTQEIFILIDFDKRDQWHEIVEIVKVAQAWQIDLVDKVDSFSYIMSLSTHNR